MSLLLSLLVGVAGAPGPDNQSVLPPKQVRAVVAGYGECIVKREERRASEAILGNVSNDDLIKRYPQLVRGECVPMLVGDAISMQFGGDQFRYAIADALVRRQLAQVPPPVLDDVPALTHREPGEAPNADAKGRPLTGRALQEAHRDYQEEQGSAYLSRYGECVVRVDPAAAKALLMTEPESGAEAAQFAAMSTALATCLAEGHTLSFGKVALRGTIAVNYYRLAMAARTAQPGGVAR
jgi:hypothetical protein